MQARSRLPGRRAHRRWPLLKPAERVVPAIKCQPTYKPGSVWRVAPPRRPFVWDAACAAPQATNPGGGRDCAWTARSTRKSARAPETSVPPLFGLAPGGVCRAASVAGGAVRSYRTVSPLPLWACRRGGLISVALSLGSPPAAVSRHRQSLEPGLSSTTRLWPQSRFARQRPSGRLTGGNRGRARAGSRGSHPHFSGPSASVACPVY
jgi:hypothetical protein